MHVISEAATLNFCRCYPNELEQTSPCQQHKVCVMSDCLSGGFTACRWRFCTLNSNVWVKSAQLFFCFLSETHLANPGVYLQPVGSSGCLFPAQSDFCLATSQHCQILEINWVITTFTQEWCQTLGQKSPRLYERGISPKRWRGQRGFSCFLLLPLHCENHQLYLCIFALNNFYSPPVDSHL